MSKKGQTDSDVNRIISKLKKKNAIIEDEIEKVLIKRKEEISIPVSAFNEKLGMLEASSLYLRDKLNLSFNDIAKILKRDYKTIWNSYDKAKKKLKNV